MTHLQSTKTKPTLHFSSHSLPSMEPFNFLKYWKGAANATPNDPFFDLELALTDEDDSQDDTNATQNDVDHDDDQHHSHQSEPDSDSDSDSDSEKEFNFTLSPSASSDHPTISLSPSHHLLFNGDILLNSQPNSKPHFTASFFKSATKLRVFMLGLKKPKPNAGDKQPNTHPKKPRHRKLFTVNFKVEEVPIVSFFTRDNSSRAKPSNTQNAEETEPSHSQIEDKRSMPKYLKMVKPLYVRVSKRYAEKLRFSDQVDATSPDSAPPCSTAPEKSPTEAEGSPTEGAAPANVKGQKQGNVPLPAGLRKHLGKGRAPPPPFESSKRRDDSLLQQHDWIQGAILHCKRSFNAASTGKLLFCFLFPFVGPFLFFIIIENW